jgi:predicted DNA-binding protein (MmcQ/YjbR family)
MNADKFRKLCLSLPGATENVQWGNDLVFKVGGKMFAVAALDASASHRASFKCRDETFAELQEHEGAVPAPYLARAKWIAIAAWDTLPDREIEARVRESHRLVFEKLPKKEQAKISAPRSPSAPRTKSGSPARARRRG